MCSTLIVIWVETEDGSVQSLGLAPIATCTDEGWMDVGACIQLDGILDG